MAALALVTCGLGQAQAAVLAPGLYSDSTRTLYVGIEHQLPDAPGNDFFEPGSQRTGELASSQHLRFIKGIAEERRVLETRNGRLGFSLYYAGSNARTTVVLVHGNDPERRAMGFIIPYFVLHGVNVVSYDQRGLGESTGDWFLNGPGNRATDVEALYDAMLGNRHVDSRRIGVWGFSNGGWTVPLVTLHRPTAFMILKSAPTETLASNIDYEVDQEMRRHGAGAASAQAVDLWHAFERGLDGTASWTDVTRRYDADEKLSWFKYSLMPDLGIRIPPPPAMVAGLRRLVTFDPGGILRHVITPTLALYGALDRNVDAGDSASHLRAYLRLAGNRDVTVATYPNAGHQFIVSRTGFNGDAEPPERFVNGYPQIVVEWLAQRGFISHTVAFSREAPPV